MKCPMCEQPVQSDQQNECACGENLRIWRGLTKSCQALRQRGLAQASQGNYPAACLSFLEASLSNPLDQRNLIDAAKALAYCECFPEALELLKNADRRYEAEADPVRKRIHTLAEHAKKHSGQTPPADELRDQSHQAAQTQPDSAAATPDDGQDPVRAAPNADPHPLLKLGILKRPEKSLKRFFNWGKGDCLPGIWVTVIGMENSWSGDWQGLEPWLRAAAAEAGKTDAGKASEAAVFHYLLGMGHVQSGQSAAAVSAFHRCLELRPPVLNPAAYYLYFHLDSGPSALKAMKRLGKVCDSSEREFLRRHLGEVLGKRGESDKAMVLEGLAAGSKQ